VLLGDGQVGEDPASTVVRDQQDHWTVQPSGQQQAAVIVQEGQIAHERRGGTLGPAPGQSEGGGDGAIDAVDPSVAHDLESPILGPAEAVHIPDGHAARHTQQRPLRE
jgi:hypothetical protein